jgi:hypothetical protein
MGEGGIEPSGTSRLSRLAHGWQPPELLMLGGGVLALLCSLATLTPGVVLGAGVPGMASALVGWRMRHLGGRGHLRGFYACAVCVLGFTVAGQAYLRMAIGGGTGSSAWLWPVATAGCVTLAGAGARLFVAGPAGRSAT